MLGFLGEGRRGGAAVGREQATNTHSGTFHDPDATSGKHQSLHPLEFPTAVPKLYLYLQMPHWEYSFLKIGAAHFSLSKIQSHLCRRQESLATLLPGQRLHTGSLWQELYLPWSLSRSAAQAGGWFSRAAGGIIPQHTSSTGKLLPSLTASCNPEDRIF